MQRAENALFREMLAAYETQLPRQIETTHELLKALSAEQLMLSGIGRQEETQLDTLTRQKQAELARHEENLAQVQRARSALNANTPPPFVWDIAFVEIFNQHGGFDIVIENPPYVRHESIAEPTLPRAEVTTENKKAYKAKLARAVYQAFPEFFGYQPLKDKVRHKLDAKSDLYVYFYFHGLSLLNPRGTFCTITSNSWLDVGYGKNLQEFLLKQCHIKMVLENSVKRSFKGVNINTVIALISAPEKDWDAALQNKVRFVNFTVPFEAILDPVIFYEIETASARVSTPEHRIRPVPQAAIFASGQNETSVYAGDKWGAKYLRAPDIYWHLLEKGRGKLVRVEDAAEKVRRGVTTGANKFFVLDRETISDWHIETEFLQPVIDGREGIKSLLIHPEQFPCQLFLCSKEKEALEGTGALAYIESGEAQKFHQRPTCRARPRWYDVGNPAQPPLIFNVQILSTARTLCARDGCYALDQFIGIYAPPDLHIPFCISLNSTLFQLMVNLGGRSNRGYGSLIIRNYELKNLLCVNPRLTDMKWSGGGKRIPPRIRRMGCFIAFPRAHRYRQRHL